MPSIPIEHAMVVWTPDTQLWRENKGAAPAGSVAVVHHPDDNSAWTRYPKSDGAGTSWWKQAADRDRLQKLADLYGQLVTTEGLNPDHVLEAFRAIEGSERVADFKPRTEEPLRD